MSQRSQELTIQQAISRAKKATKEGNTGVAVDLYQAILKRQPNNFFVRKQLCKLKKQLPRSPSAMETPSSPPPDQIAALVALYHAGQMVETEQACRELLKTFPQTIVVINVLGATLHDQGKLQEAVQVLNNAVHLNPDYADTYSNIGITLRALGKFEEAEQSHRKAIALKPNHAVAHSNLGNTLQELGKFEEAEASHRTAILLKPDYAEAHYNMGNALRDQGKIEEAVAAFNKALLIKPDYAEAHNNIGEVFETQGKIEGAFAAFSKALLIKPDYAEAHNNLGVALKGQGKIEEAIAAYNKALLIKPDYAETHRNLSTLKKYEYSDPQIAQMEKLYSDANISDEERCHLCFALAKSSEDVGNLEKAFRYFKEGNALRKKVLNYDIVQDEELFSRIRKTANSFKNVFFNASGKEDFPTPILILGMPRSGTTLVEQIISNHSKITPGDELSFLEMFGSPLAVGETEITSEMLKKVRNQYLSELKKLSLDRPFITDKMPSNFLYISLICNALPEAKIIHVKRNPAATCWSNYKQHFAEGLGYSYDLFDLVHYYKMYEDLMLFWDEHYPGQIHHLGYEQLTTDQESETKKLIQYLDIDWEDACLFPEENKRYVKTASNLQVRKKVYKGSSEEWKKFEKYLDKAFVGLSN